MLLLLLAALAACAPLRDGPARGRPGARPSDSPSHAPVPRGGGRLEDYPRSPEEISGPAVLSLLERAREALEGGHAEQAVASLEVALDIEPRNPFVWQGLAEAHLEQDLPDQAESQAQRSNSFARGNPFVEVENWRVIAEAREARGDLSGAELARGRVTELRDRLGE